MCGVWSVMAENTRQTAADPPLTVLPEGMTPDRLNGAR